MTQRIKDSNQGGAMSNFPLEREPAYLQGFEAGKRGVPWGECPYATTEARMEEWAAGHLDGQKEAR